MQASAPTLPLSSQAEDPAKHAAAVVCLSKLPPFHPAALKLLNISSESLTATTDFETVFKSDPALTADLLLVANSAQFGRRSEVATIRHAISYLGLERVRSLATTIAVCFFVRSVPRSDYLRTVWEHSIASGVIAESLGFASRIPDLYTAGLTHDLGRLGMLLAMGKNYDSQLSTEFNAIDEANQRESQLFGMTHCEAGARVGLKWSFPPVLQACMFCHHDPSAALENDPVGLVHLACRMADHLGFPEVRWRDEQAPPHLPTRLRNNPDLDPNRLRDRIAAQIEVITT